MYLEQQTYNKKITLGTGKCKKCGGETCIKKRLEPSPKQLRKNYYFSKSETCTKCGAIWLKEEDKVYTNKSLKLENLTEKSNEEFIKIFYSLIEYNSHDFGEMGKFIKLEYATNMLIETFRRINKE